MTLLQEYLSLTKQYKEQYGENTIVLMQVGAFFEVYAITNKEEGTITGSSITEFAKICDLNIAEKKMCVGDDNVIMAGFSHYMIDKYLKKLQDVGFTSVIYTQDENIKTNRSLAGIYSPGTFFSTESSNITNNTTCIWIDVINSSIYNTARHNKCKKENKKKIFVGISNIDIITGKTNMFEFNEIYLNSPTTFDHLERFISIFIPSEVIIVGQNISDGEIDEIIQYAGIECLSIHKINITNKNDSKNGIQAMNCEKQIYQTEILKKFYSKKNIVLENFYEKSYATQSFCYLLDFIYQHNPSLVNKISEPIFENCSDKLILANHSLKQLNIIQDKYNGKFSSVEKLTNQCVTPMGKRFFSTLLVNPTTNVDYLQKEYNMTEWLIENVSDVDFLRNKMTTIKDLSKINRQIIMKRISPKTLYYLYHNLNTIKELSISRESFVNEYIRSHNIICVEEHCREIMEFIEETMDISSCETIDCFSQFETNFIKKNVDSHLDKQYKCLLESSDKLEAIRLFLNNKIASAEKKEKTNEYVKKHETEKLSIHLVATKRRCVLLKNEISSSREKMIPLTYFSTFSGKKESFVFDIDSSFLFEAQSGSNEFILHPQINELCKNVTTIKNQLKELITQIYIKCILDKLSESFSDKVEKIIEYITYLDSIYTKAFIAKKYHYCKPIIDTTSDKSFFNAKGMRHPLIEHLQTNEIYVTNDLELGSKETIDGVLLYGTNAVGKTSLIRAIGINIIMAQAGLFVPCSYFMYKPYQYIFTRILGNDNIFKGLSTFAVEMSELRTILKICNKDSLVLGDELCSGTESISAKSIFVAGVQTLIEKKSSFIFATHLHEIIEYEEINKCEKLALKHMAVSYDRENDRLVYDRKIKDGAGNNMYGLEVCRSLSLSQEFLTLADNIRMKYNPISSSLLSLKKTKYNSKKIRSLCENCGKKMSSEIHHLIPQKNADKNGMIQTEDGGFFHKNHLANLMAVCEECHLNFHK
jgi:DNA mismatch repair protein MutS